MPQSNFLLSSKIVVNEVSPSTRTAQGVTTSVTGLIGVCERGPINTPTFVTSYEEFKNTFGGHVDYSPFPNQVEMAFRNGLTSAWITRVVKYTDMGNLATKQSAQGSQMIVDRGGAAVPAEISSVTGPFAIEDGQAFYVDVDNSGAVSDTFSFSPATTGVSASGPFVFGGETLTYTVKLPGQTVAASARTITFPAGSKTVAETAAYINENAIGIKAVVSGGTFTIKSDMKGTGATLVVSGSAVSFVGMTAGSFAGAGDAYDSEFVTAAEVATFLNGFLTTGSASSSGQVVTITGVTTGVSGEVEIASGTTVTSVFAGSIPIVENGSAAGETDTIEVVGKYDGDYIENYSIVVEDASSGESDEFNLSVKLGSSSVEVFPNLSMDAAATNYFETVINENSSLIEVNDQFSVAVSPNNLPALGTYSAWTGASNGLPDSDANYIGDQSTATGLYSFDQVSDLNLVAVPGVETAAIANALVTYCEVTRNKSCFSVMAVPSGMDEQQAKTYADTTAAIQELSEFGAVYWPWIKILNPSKAIYGASDQLTISPVGAVIGVYARNDGSSPGGVYLAPAGIERGVIFGCLGFESDDTLDERKRDVVYPVRINPITTEPGSPRYIDGSRTLKSTGNFPSISERRGVIYIEQSLKRALLYAKHRNNDEKLRAEVANTCNAFLLQQFNNGAFRGSTPAESFYVDASTNVNTPEVVFANQLKVEIGLATQKPAEWIILTVTQDTRAIDERLAEAQ